MGLSGGAMLLVVRQVRLLLDEWLGMSGREAEKG